MHQLSRNLILKLGKDKISMICCIGAAALFVLMPAAAIELVSTITRYVINRFGLGYIIFSSLLVLLALVIAIGPWGKIKLGRAGDKPEFGLFSWLAMLFAAGMGSGLIFWGVAEPIYHYANPPAFAANDPSPQDMALALTYFHWGIHAWSIYAIAGLVMAWFAFNRQRDMTISASFSASKQSNRYQLFDFVAVIAVIFGVAGTLANSIALIETGASQLISPRLSGEGFQLALLLFIAGAFTLSSVLGLERGIKHLSQFHLIFMLIILAVVIIWSSPMAVLSTLVNSSLNYLEQLPRLSFTIDNDSRQWSEGWSVIYLLWWIAWAPFVGPFIARISRGRTIRQFLLCTILVPTLTSILWFSAFASSAFDPQYLSAIIDAVNQDFTQGIYQFFSYLPLGKILSGAAILLLMTFIVTSADSAIYVTAMLTGNNKLSSKLMWSAILVAITLALIHQQSVDLNKQVAIVGAIPFTLILIAQIVVFVRQLIGQPDQAN